MDELRVVRSDEQALILATEDGREFRLTVDDAVLGEIRLLAKRDRRPSTARPRDIQMHLRAGKSRTEVAALMELEESDVERFEEPVLAERRHILESAHRVPVRTDGAGGEQSGFGHAVEARLDSLGATETEWRTWKDGRDPWHIGLAFTTPDTVHDAIWEFDHRKHTLRPTNTDAINLSKQGDVGPQLIPKLRAVDDREPSAPEALEDLAMEPETDTPADSAAATDIESAESEYERLREIEQRAVKTVDEERADLSQTADLLDALRRRRGDRDAQHDAPSPENLSSGHPVAEGIAAQDSGAGPAASEPRPRALSIWSGKGVSDGAAQGDSGTSTADSVPAEETAPPRKPEKPKNQRSSIPSWDDILFGTRSDEDPA